MSAEAGGVRSVFPRSLKRKNKKKKKEKIYKIKQTSGGGWPCHRNKSVAKREKCGARGPALCLPAARSQVGGRAKGEKTFSLGIQFCNLSDFISISRGERGKKSSSPPAPSTHIEYTYLPIVQRRRTYPILRIFMQSDTADDSSDHLESVPLVFFLFFPSVRRHRVVSPRKSLLHTGTIY